MSPSKRVTIRDVAAAANVSVTTVSDSLSGKGRLPEATRRRVVAEAAKLGYQASATAKNLKHGRTGVLLMSITTPNMDPSAGWNVEFFVKVMSSASEYASMHGYALAMAPLQVGDSAPSIPCDGVLVVDPIVESPLVRRALRENIPLVTIGTFPGNELFVDNDYSAIVPGLLDEFARAGAKRPALMTTSTQTSYTADTVAAYEEWCLFHAVTPMIHIVHGGLGENDARLQASRWAMEADPPDAILATLDSIAKGALDGLRLAGTEVPDVCMVVSLTDSVAIAAASIPITAFDIQPAVMGREAARLLIERIEGVEGLGPVLVDASLIPRDSAPLGVPR